MVVYAVYWLVGIINLVCAFFFRELVRKITKACLMPVLLGFYLVGTDSIMVLIVMALVFSWVGDVLLINKDKPVFFKLGLASFLISHLYYLIAFLVFAGTFHLVTLIISLVIAIPLTVYLLKLLNPSKEMKIPVTAYAVVITLMSLAALQLLVAHPCVATTLIFVGSLVYLFSDSLMAYLLFHTKPKHFNVITMVPYIVAQGCIVLGLVLGI